MITKVKLLRVIIIVKLLPVLVMGDTTAKYKPGETIASDNQVKLVPRVLEF